MKNIIIISKSNLETSTEEVIDFIHYLGHKVIRINGDEFESTTNNILINSNGLFKIRNKTIKLKCHSVWLRRWSDFKFTRDLFTAFDTSKTSSSLRFTITQNIISDYLSVLNILYSNIKARKYLTNLEQLQVNKLHVLYVAKNIGLNIPYYILTNSKKELLNFSRKYKILIKDLTKSTSIIEKDKIILPYGVILNKDQINLLPNYFPLSFFQQYIEKVFEIRVFFIDNKCFSMAIFSQDDDSTKIDFRRYNNSNPNRIVPYNLPLFLENKIRSLMYHLKLNTGSIDILKTTNNEYVFLEINPVGQFGMVSHPCNYNLELEIAKYLIK